MPKAVLINDSRVDLHHGCNRIIESMYRLARSNGIDIIGTAAARSDWRRNPDFMARFAQADIVIVNAESLHHDRYLVELVLLAGEMARKLSKRSAILNMSWFSNSKGMSERLSAFDIVAVRESRSFEEVRAFRPDCRLVPDLVFYGPKSNTAHRQGVGFGDSVLMETADELLSASKRFAGEFIPIRYPGPGLPGTYKLLRSLVSRQTFQGPAAFLRSMRLALAHLRNARRDTDELSAVIAKLELLVTGRFHGLALALCARTPVLVASSNTPKIEPLLSDIGLRPWRLISTDQIDRPLLDRASHWHDDELGRIDQYLTTAVEEAETLFRDIRALA